MEDALVVGDNHVLPVDGDGVVKDVAGSAFLETSLSRVVPPQKLLPAAAPKLPANPGTLGVTPESLPCPLSDVVPM